MARDYDNIVPDSTRLSSKFNLERVHPVTGEIRPHRGVDIASPNGTPVYTAVDGVVVQKKVDPAGYGNYVVLQHSLPRGEVIRTVYGHLHLLPTWEVGNVLSAGEQIGEVGNTGASTGNHLHYEERKVAKGFESVAGDNWKDGTTPIDPERNVFALTNISSKTSKSKSVEGDCGVSFTNPDIAYTSPADANSNHIPDILESQIKNKTHSSHNFSLEQKVALVASQANLNGWDEQQKQQFYDILAKNANTMGLRVAEERGNINTSTII